MPSPTKATDPALVPGFSSLVRDRRERNPYLSGRAFGLGRRLGHSVSHSVQIRCDSELHSVSVVLKMPRSGV